MARKKDVYERISEKEVEIREAEERLDILRQELRVLNAEMDDLEMKSLFQFIRDNGISFEDAKALMTKTA